MVLGELIGTNEVQKLTPSVGANEITGGTFTITYSGQTTAAIAAIASAAEIQAALEALSNVGAGNIHVSGGPIIADDVFLEFTGALGQQNVAQVTVTLSLTSGGTAAVTVSTVTGGAVGTPGYYAPYVEGNTDGSGLASALMEFDAVTDASSNITFGSQAQSEWGESHLTAPVYVAGTFRTDDLVQTGAGAIDQNAVTYQHPPLGKLMQGTTALGLLRMG